MNSLVSRDLDDVRHLCADAYERLFDVLEGLHRLGVEIVLADHSSIAIECHQPGELDPVDCELDDGH